MKIVTLLPSATEIVCALNLQDSLAAVSHECDFPPQVTSLPRITSSIIPSHLSPAQIDTAVVQAVHQGDALYRVDGDLLRELAPDLIITQGLCDVCAVDTGTVQETMLFLPDVVANGVQILSLSGKTFAGILRDITQVAAAAKAQPAAHALNTALRARWQQLQQQQPVNKPTVLLLEWPNPFFFGGHWVPEMIEAAGGVDVMGQIGLDSGRCTLADIQDRNPDIIIVAACGYDLAQNIELAHQLLADPKFRQLSAVQHNQIWAMDANSYCSRPGPRIVDGAEKLQAIFHGWSQNVTGITAVGL